MYVHGLTTLWYMVPSTDKCGNDLLSMNDVMHTQIAQEDTQIASAKHYI